jgi:hypothetical protein
VNNWYIGSRTDVNYFKGSIYECNLYNTKLTPTEVAQLYHGNTSYPYTTAVEVVTSAETATSDVTINGIWTEDTTLISESESDGEVSISINHTAGSNATGGYLEYEPSTDNFTYNLTLDSTNPNASAFIHNQTINISTGEQSAGETDFYNMTLDSLESFNYTVNWLTKTSTRATFEYNSTNSNVENDFYLENMSASSTFDFKYPNGTILANATSDSSGLLKFDDVGGVTDSYKLINDTYTIEKQSSTVSFVAVVFTGLSFVGLYFYNRFRRR